MLRFFILFILVTSLFSAEVKQYKWANGESYLTFLEKHHLPLKSLYYNLDKDDQFLTKEMISGVKYQILKSSDGEIQQLLLPINNKLQIHIYQQGDGYKFEAIPIICTTKKEALTLKITSSLSYTIVKATGSKKLARILVSAFQKSLNFKKDLRSGDRMVMLYEQSYRLGAKFAMPVLKAALIEMRGKKYHIYLNEADDNFYNERGSRVENFLLIVPVKGARISSYFTKRRFHPILKKWKAHLGIDYAVRRGTPIRAAGNGTIIYAKNAGSYGNLIKIRHNDGYETRYAHMKSFRKGMRRGKRVKKGQIIGYVGTTGRSTGPHLHFELRKNGRPINPLKIVKISGKKLYGKVRKKFLRMRKKYDENMEYHLKRMTKYKRTPALTRECYFNNI
jgi:murein DD-endopeptidase MepM/ murein hydrolase activator NlpD